MGMDLDPHSTIQPSEFEARKLDHLQSLLLSINIHQRFNYDYGSWPTFSGSISNGRVIECGSKSNVISKW